MKVEDEEERGERRRARDSESDVSTGASVFAAGRNTAPAEIAAGVRERLARFIRNIIRTVPSDMGGMAAPSFPSCVRAANCMDGMARRGGLD